MVVVEGGVGDVLGGEELFDVGEGDVGDGGIGGEVVGEFFEDPAVHGDGFGAEVARATVQDEAVCGLGECYFVCVHSFVASGFGCGVFIKRGGLL